MPLEVKSVPLLRIWDLFFQACKSLGAQLLLREAVGGRHWLTRSELEELGPRTIVGIPALVLLRTALRGACAERGRCPRKALLLCSGQVLTAESFREAGNLTDAFVWLMEAQEALKAARVRYRDLPALDGLALWEGDLAGLEVLMPGEDVENVEDLPISSLFRLPAGSPGVVVEVSQATQEALVQWDTGRCRVEAAKLRKLGGNRPKPLEALPQPEAAERLAKMQVAVGRARAAAVALSSTPTFIKFFQPVVVTPLLEDKDLEQCQPELMATTSGGLVWRTKSGLRSRAPPSDREMEYGD